MAGPVMSIPSIAALTAMFQRRVVVAYVAFGFLGSVALGLMRLAFG
jgi:uncharacterized membrane protein YraQ (UPF0718 family)